jgi:hypothetical protein
VAGLLVNPLGAIATILLKTADFCLFMSRRKPAPNYEPAGPPVPAAAAGPGPDSESSVIESDDSQSVVSPAVQPAAKPKRAKEGGKTAGTGQKPRRQRKKRARRTIPESSGSGSTGGVRVTPSAQVPVVDPADRVPVLDQDGDVTKSEDSEPGNLIRVPCDLAVPSDLSVPSDLAGQSSAGGWMPDTEGQVSDERDLYGSVKGDLPSLSSRPRATPEEISRVGVMNFVVREINRIRQTIANEGAQAREMGEMFDASRNAVDALGESSRELSKSSN